MQIPEKVIQREAGKISRYFYNKEYYEDIEQKP